MARAVKGRKKKARTFAWPIALGSRERVLLGAALTFLCLYGLSVLEDHVWLGALLRELHLHLGLLALLLAASAFATRAWLMGALAFATGVLFFSPLFPLYRPTSLTPAHGPTLTLAHAHLAGESLDARALRAFLERARFPSVVALTGLREKEAPSLVNQIASYRGHAHEASELLLVHERVQRARFAVSETDVLFGTLRVGRCDVRTFVVDLPSRFDFRKLKARGQRIAALTKESKTLRSVWLGHLGSSVEASDLAPFLSARELRDSRRGHGRLPTAPASFGFLGVPLDHALVHGWIGVRARSVSEGPVKEGHRAVHLTIELTEPRCQP